MMTVTAKRSLMIFLCSCLSCLVMDLVLFTGTRFHPVWGALLPAFLLTLTAVILHQLGKVLFKGFYLVSAALNSVAAGLLFTAFYNHKKIPVRMTGLLYAYILFIALALIFCVMFVYIRKRWLMALLGGLLLAGVMAGSLFFRPDFLGNFFLFAPFHVLLSASYFMAYMLSYRRRRGVLRSISLTSFSGAIIISLIVLLFLSEGDASFDFDFDLSGSKKKEPFDDGKPYPWL